MSEGWSIHRRNKTSGKSRGGVFASGLSEYVAKTLCNDANRGSSCFHYTPIDPAGNRWKLFQTCPEDTGTWRIVDWAERVTA